MRYQQTIIIPAYKPSENIVGFVEELQKHFDDIVVVDDGGQDEFAIIFARLKEMGADVVTHAVNMGKGRALKSAFNYCLTKENPSVHGVITVDADGQHRVEDIIKVAKAMSESAEAVVLGCRNFNTGNVPARSLFGNNVSRVLYKWLAGIAVSDTQTGLRGLPFSILPALTTCVGERYEYETNMFLVIKELGYLISEVSIETVYEDNNSSSHFNPIRDSIRIYSVILKYSVSSLVSSLVDYLVFGIAIACGAPIMIATYIARAISSVFNFLINKKLVFKGKGNATIQFVKYIILVIVSGTISGLAVTGLSNCFTSINPIIIKIPVEVVLYFFNYVVQQTFIFKDKKIRKK